MTRAPGHRMWERVALLLSAVALDHEAHVHLQRSYRFGGSFAESSQRQAAANLAAFDFYLDKGEFSPRQTELRAIARSVIHQLTAEGGADCAEFVWFLWAAAGRVDFAAGRDTLYTGNIAARLALSTSLRSVRASATDTPYARSLDALLVRPRADDRAPTHVEVVLPAIPPFAKAGDRPEGDTIWRSTYGLRGSKAADADPVRFYHRRQVTSIVRWILPE